MYKPKNSHPLDHFERNSAEVRERLKKTGEPEILTVEGKAAVVVMSPEAFAAWGWRIPFLASAVLIGVGLYVRMQIAETPTFAKAKARNEKVKLPFADVLREQWRQVLLGGGMLSMTFGSFYIAVVFLTGYAGQAEGTGVLGL
jgi:MFS family permease